MTQYLPYDGFKWFNQKKIYKFDVNSIECNSIEKNSSNGYILIPEKTKFNHNMLSNY